MADNKQQVDDVQLETANEISEDVKLANGNVEKTFSKEDVERWLTKDDNGKKFAQSFTDSRVSNAIKTFEENHFEQRVKERVETELRKMHPDETEDQKRLRELEIKFAKKEREAKKAEMGRIALQYVNQIQLDGVPEKIINSFIAESEEQTRMNIDDFKKYILYREEKKANAILARNSHVPPGSDDKGIFATREELNAAIQKAGNNWRSNQMLVKEYERLAKK